MFASFFSSIVDLVTAWWIRELFLGMLLVEGNQQRKIILNSCGKSSREVAVNMKSLQSKMPTRYRFGFSFITPGLYFFVALEICFLKTLFIK